MASSRKTTAPRTPPRAKEAAQPPRKAGASPARMVAKVSPLRGTSVDDYIAGRMTGWQAEVAREIVELFASVAPEAKPVVKWSQPVFELDGPVAYMRSAKAHLTFGFWRGADLDDPAGLLEGDGDRMKHLKISARADFDRGVAERLIRQAVRLNREQGDPARRAK